MTDINIMELAEYCVNRYKERLDDPREKYIKTLFIAITKEEDIITSMTPHILKEAEQCILIHEKSRLALTNRYSWYDIEFINSTGSVYHEQFDNKFCVYITNSGTFDNQIMRLRYENREILNLFKRPWENSIVKVWKLYSRLKDIESYEEIKLIAKLFSKDEKILELEKQIEDFKFTNHLLEQELNQYKLLLDNIKQMIETK